MMYWAVLLVAFLINTVGIRVMPLVENGVLFFHVLTFLAVLIPLVVLAPHSSAEYVFTTFENNSGWTSDGVAWCLGLLSATYVLVGYDGAVHLSTTPMCSHQSKSLAVLTMKQVKRCTMHLWHCLV